MSSRIPRSESSSLSAITCHRSSNTRVTSHYLISFADSEADLFGTNSKTFEIQRVSYANSDIIELDEVVTAKYFAIKVLNGVCAAVDNAENKNGIGSSNFARIGHISLGGESLACENDAHNWGEDIIDVAADCQNPGSKHKECIDCGAETEAEEIPVTGHNHVGVETLKPSCDKLGVMTYTCPDCGDEYTENIPMIPHTETEIPAVAPECEKDGSTAGVKCSICDEVLEAPQVDPATGHDWKLDKENEVKYCANECGKTIDIFVITFLSKDGENVLRVFTNIYNPNNDVVTESGVIFLPGSIYDTKVVGEGKEFDLDLAKELGEGYAYVASSSANANQLLVTYGGIATNVPNLRRVSRAYAIINGQTYYSSAIKDDMFNK